MKYFTISELRHEMGINEEWMNKILARYADFPIIRMSTEMRIIPKNRFFVWYSRHLNDPMIAGKFKNYGIVAMWKRCMEVEY